MTKAKRRPVPAKPSESTGRSRERIVAAAREVLLGRAGFAGFNIDAVAKQAGVTRMTVYYQFGGKPGLLEALFDEIAARGEIAERLPLVFQAPDLATRVDLLVAAYVHFWASDREVIRRIRSLAALDPELDNAHMARDGWRLMAAQALLLGRRGGPSAPIPGPSGPPPGVLGALANLPEDVEQQAAALQALTSFELYDNLVRSGRSQEEIESMLRDLARSAVGLAGASKKRPRKRPRKT
jgi:AcrR family transcriptional regulator